MTEEDVKAPWRNSLTAKLLVRFWISILLFSLIIGGIQYQALNQFLIKGEIQDLQAQIGLFNTNQLEIWFNHKQPFPTAWPDLRPGVVIGFFSKDKAFEAILGHQEIKLKNANTLEKSFFLNQIQKNKLRTNAIFKNQKGTRYLVIFRPININTTNLLGYAVVSVPLTQIDNTLHHQFQVFLISILLILIIGGISTFYILQKPLLPLLHMSEISSKIAAGNYDLRIPDEPSASELSHLRSVLNHMLETLHSALATEKEAKEQMSRFIADASHELRTPLTSIRGFLEILLRGHETDPKTLTSAHETMLTETDRLIQLTEDLLTLNRLNIQAAQKLQSKPDTSVQTVLPELLPLLNSLLAYRTLDIQAEELSLPVESGELKQIIYNLVHNAIQHTPVNGKIILKIGTGTERKYISVTDNGEGIAPQDLPYVFERFYRGSRSRERKAGSGAGLGLSIVWEIVNLRGGKLDVKSELGQGTTFFVFFPK